ncbi:alpha/beta hydrolase [Nannocystis bainbridge]|uniref:Alpha/beta hydrolase n=1 Tax=Nannocystis bainbridge TaxID=2995303 RepID=A0ABT5DX63_9BACT|nr:alpha/beta hydrolase [Nannocystis bainbridge]MDC0717740.1 alpha/beta hydrolase [Nannocystis bainbridge]
MASLQSHLLYQMIRYWRRRHPIGEFTPDSYKGVRKTIERGVRQGRLPPGVYVEPAEVGGVPGEWIHAVGARADKVLLYLHGGGYVAGSPASHRMLTAALSREARVRVLALDYRLAPEYPYPAALDDAMSGYTWLLDQGYSPGSIAIGGDSAGGGLTAATLVRLRDAGTLPLPAAAFMLSPWTDLAATGESVRTRAALDPMLGGDMAAFGRYYVGPDGDPRHPLISPIHADLRGLPPILIQVGTREVLHDDSIRLAERVRAAQGRVELEIWDGMIHVFQAFPSLLPEARRAIRKIGEFLRAELV